MSKVVINFKVDSQVKEQAKSLAKELGVPLSVIINAQLKELLRNRTLSLSAQPTMTDSLEKLLADVEADRATGRNVTRTRSIKEAVQHLNSL